MPTGGALCLNADRFRVTARWSSSQSSESSAGAASLGATTGYFWFFDSSNVEITVKVLDGCSLNERFWVFTGALTNVAVDMTVEDLYGGETLVYSNPLGTPFAPIQDTSAFDSCQTPDPPLLEAVADRSRLLNFQLAIARTTATSSGRALCNPSLTESEWMTGISKAAEDGPLHERWRLCHCPQVLGECQAEAEIARQAL